MTEAGSALQDSSAQQCVGMPHSGTFIFRGFILFGLKRLITIHSHARSSGAVRVLLRGISTI